MGQVFGVLLLLQISFIAFPAWTATLNCGSREDQLFGQSGVLEVAANIDGPVFLRNLRILFSGDSKLNSGVEAIEGRASDAFARFFAGANNFCSYRLALPITYFTQRVTYAYVDATCADARFYPFRLNCEIKD